ncbi:IclR family transcriptional regulator [Paracoccus aerodenitrificans]|uniref:IclR family transcriptional regulator n=1 Tax=Paracoccus aerodenitrificans TaxID=3017781 RepID=UPI0022F02C45|nr:helix-turn-helix domain-containing protein [Paracoccus aerodenitrificans]WBU63638.1 helix-turn-helix domain-containing protein [Paracoccus aerodenitrificans]
MEVRQAANVLELLEFFSKRRQPATMTEIAEALHWPRSSTFNMIGTLARRGYLYEPSGRGGYYPTPRWLSISQAVAEADPLPSQVVAAACCIRDVTDETTCIASLSGTSAIMLFVAESRQPIRYFAEPGSRVPIHASSVGRALLSLMLEADRQTLYRRMDFKSGSPNAPQTKADVERELQNASERGYHQSDSEYVPDLAGVAVALPILTRSLSLVVAGPTSRCIGRRSELVRSITEVLNQYGLGV